MNFMRSISLRTLLALASLLTVALPAVTAAQDSDDEGINWLTSYKQAIEEAKKTGKPIFLEFRCEA